MKKYILALALFLVVQPALANETMLGVAAGPSVLLGNDDGTPKNGYHLEVKGDRSLEYDDHNIDLGLGYFYNNISGNMSNGQQIRVKTYGLFLEADYKFRISDSQFYIGPSVKALFGPDVSFDSTDDGSDKVNALVGVKAQYDLKLSGRVNSKIDAGIYSSVVSPNNFIALIGINFGLKDKDTVVNEEVARRSEEQIERDRHSVYSPTVAPPVVIQETTVPVIVRGAPVVVRSTEDAPVMITLKAARVLFNTGAFAIDQDLKGKLRQLGAYLRSNPSSSSKIRITGHTDNVGSAATNIQLSLKRAEAIKRELVNAGVSESKIEIVGMGFSKPLASNDTSSGRERNRRTEIEFFGVQDRAEFNRVMTEILK